MSLPPTAESVSEILLRAQQTLGMTQQQLGDVIGCSSRTIMRHQQHGGYLSPSGYEALARACHPHDPAFAAELAQHAGKTLVDLGLERPPPMPAAPTPTHEHLLDSIVCAAAEAMQTTPQAMRPGLKAAFERVVALGMSAEEVLAAMAAPSAKPGKSKGKSA